MADTIRGDFENTPCSDCKQTGKVCFKHWGPLAPSGQIGYFCSTCWIERSEYFNNHGKAKPMAV